MDVVGASALQARCKLRQREEAPLPSPFLSQFLWSPLEEWKDADVFNYFSSRDRIRDFSAYEPQVTQVKSIEENEEGDVVCKCVLRPPSGREAASTMKERTFLIRKMDLHVNEDHARSLRKYEDKSKKETLDAVRETRKRKLGSGG
jgi:hypothetical protein